VRCGKKTIVAELADLLRGVADGTPPATDSDLIIALPPDDRSVGVLAFPGQHIIVADVTAEWVRSWLPDGDLAGPLSPPFLTLLSAVTGRAIGNVDTVLVARGHGRRRGLDLTEITDSDHPWIARARLHRADVRAMVCPGGLLVLGRGVAGRWEAAVQVDAALRGFGLGRGLFAAALGLVDEGEPVWAQVAPGNAASLRALLAAGYRPVGAEVLLEPRTETEDDEPVEWFGSYLPPAEWDDDEDDVPPAQPEAEAEPSEPEPEPEAEPRQAEPRQAEPRQAEPEPEPEPEPEAEPRQAEPQRRQAEPEPRQAEPRHAGTAPKHAEPGSVGPPQRSAHSHAAPATAAEVAAAEAAAAAELAADEDTELAERDEPRL
jgi:hypothetical protein